MMRELDGAVHDVRGALTVISGQCFTLGRQGDPAIAATLRLIEREVERVRQALDRMAGTPDPVPRRLDVGAIARDVAEANVAQALARDRHIAIFVGQGLVTIGRESRLRAAVENLVQNAVRHAPGGTAVMVRAIREQERVVVEVIDEGPGVPTEDRDRIFVAGQRGTRPVGRGSGLGLTIARQVALEHGGALELANTLIGATFRLSLPCREESA